MEAKKLSSIKRQFKHNNESLLINHIGIFHVDVDKNVSGAVKKFCDLQDMNQGKSGSDAYWDLVEEDNFLEIIKKTLSGQLEKNLIEYEFQDPDKKKDLSLALAGNLNPGVAASYANHIAQTLRYTGTYAILLASCELNGVSRDGKGYKTTDDDLCDVTDTYQFMITSVCPMKSVELGLVYDKENASICRWAGKEYEVAAPVAGFLYPSMTDEDADEDRVLVYNKNLKEPLRSLVSDILGCKPVTTREEEKQIFDHIISKVLEGGEKEEIKEITAIVKEKVADMVKEENSVEEIPVITPQKLKDILSDSGVQEERLAMVDTICEVQLGNQEMLLKAENVLPPVKPKKPDVVIDVKDGNTDIVKTQTIDGKKCLIIELREGVEIKGFDI